MNTAKCYAHNNLIDFHFLFPFCIQNDFCSFNSRTGGFGVWAGGCDILAFCQQAMWRTASLERKWTPPGDTPMSPPFTVPLSFQGLGDRTIWAGLLEWEVFNCQMLNRLCSLHLAQYVRVRQRIHTHTHTHTYTLSIYTRRHYRTIQISGRKSKMIDEWSLAVLKVWSVWLWSRDKGITAKG